MKGTVVEICSEGSRRGKCFLTVDARGNVL